MEFLDSIMTRFVRERLKETSWEKREYISNLHSIERIIAHGGPKGWAQAIQYRQLSDTYPVETECIEREINESILVTTEEFLIKLKRYKENKRIERKMRALKRDIQETKDKFRWQSLMNIK